MAKYRFYPNQPIWIDAEDETAAVRELIAREKLREPNMDYEATISGLQIYVKIKYRDSGEEKHYRGVRHEHC